VRDHLNSFADWFEDAPMWAYCLVAAFCGTLTAIILEACRIFFLE
jgi:hypothetical protein